jgi:SAM-dependent methyltransferase
MRNETQWKPSKYVYNRGVLRASRDPREVRIPTRLIADRVAALYEAHIPHHCRGRLIDLGCGKVPLYQVYRPFVTDITCVDRAQSLYGGAYVDVECDLTQRLPFDDAQFDTVILSDVLEHLPEPARTWQEMRRILTTGGKVLMNVPFLYGLHEQPHDYFRYTEYALRRFATTNRFRVVLLKQVGGSPDALADIGAKNAAHLPLIGAACAMGIQGMVWWFGKTSFGRRLSEQTSVTFPLGYFMISEKSGEGDSR